MLFESSLCFLVFGITRFLDECTSYESLKHDRIKFPLLPAYPVRPTPLEPLIMPVPPPPGIFFNPFSSFIVCVLVMILDNPIASVERSFLFLMSSFIDEILSFRFYDPLRFQVILLELVFIDRNPENYWNYYC